MPRAKKSQRRVFINYILDESGSMDWTVTVPKVIEGFNEYVSGLRRDAEGEIFFTLTKFSLNSQTVYAALPLAKVPDLTTESYVPGAGTALLDAVANTIKTIDKDVTSDDKVIVVIMTDGQENSSRENTQSAVANLIGAKQKEGNWTFVFLGADQDAWDSARGLGIHAGNVMSYSSHTHLNTMRGLAGATVTATASPDLASANYFNDAGQSQADYDDPNKIWVPSDVKEPEKKSSSN